MSGTAVDVERIGLIAGNGTFPILFAQAAKRLGVRKYAVGMVGETEPALSWAKSIP
ncbi:MAG: hypothetical protein R3C68_07865 [Myxococcota bacterium]